ncbi:Mitochondrial dicarboxylate carrier [Eumeta japonica]|uniref:Mitochondrial dicarboxylate carrier n=1 Tax=Eumeta variegata TaxID=151549 RepID=A0A4C1VTD2_EUMVA|nr:Mitochondrial dicarboxylate carrier [Eumeta japonica]
MVGTSKKEIRLSRWYFGGLASAGAACVTHPLDLLKVQMQTQRGKNASLIKLTANVLKEQGIMGLYNGISASLLRQLTYSMVRFAIYEQVKQVVQKDGSSLTFVTSAAIAGVAGLAGGWVGTPADMVNVRMQNDIRLPPEQRRNYKNAIHGLWRVYRIEGVTRLWSGASMACARAVFMNIGQLSFYDLIKGFLLSTPYFNDNVITHVSSSLAAGGIATTLTQPVDVLKTRAMNSKAGEFKGVFHLFLHTAKEGPLAFYKGYIPAFVPAEYHGVVAGAHPPTGHLQPAVWRLMYDNVSSTP